MKKDELKNHAKQKDFPIGVPQLPMNVAFPLENNANHLPTSFQPSFITSFGFEASSHDG